MVLDDERDVGATICMMARNAGYETDYTDSIDVFMERLETVPPTHVAFHGACAGASVPDACSRAVRPRSDAARTVPSSDGIVIWSMSSSLASHT